MTPAMLEQMFYHSFMLRCVSVSIGMGVGDLRMPDVSHRLHQTLPNLELHVIFRTWDEFPIRSRERIEPILR